MKINMFLPSILIIFFILIGYLLFKPKKLVVGYCPTMTAYLNDLQNNKNISLVAYNSSQEALSNLTNNKVDCVVIGRKAKNHEVTDNVSFKQFDENATTLVKAINADNSEAFLLSWKEVDYSQVELVILTDEKGHKLAEHRTPFLYYSIQKNNRQIEEVEKLIKENI